MSQASNPAHQQPAPQPPYVLSLDVGTSSTRTLLFDANGNTVPGVVAQSKYKLTTSGQGEVSVDADMLAEVVVQTIDDALKTAGPLAQHIAAVSMDTFWHSLLGVDDYNQPLTPVITWEDTRAFGAAAELGKKLDEQAVHDRTGARFHASYWPAKLFWLSANQPDIFARVKQWISFGEYLHRKFLGHSVCSLSMASGTGMLRTRARAWDDELMTALDVKPVQMPTLGDTHDAVKGLNSQYAKRWPALRDIPWFPAIGDGASACIGSGCASIENWSLTIGTSSAMRVVLSPEQVVPPMGLWLYLIDGKRAVLGGALSEGGNLVSWLDATLKWTSLQAAEKEALNLSPDAHGLTLLPYISGERSLGWHADARMTISGISLHTTPADMLRASCEALAYHLLAMYREIRFTLQVEQQHLSPKVICSGGALLSSTLLQSIVSDTLDTPLYPSLDHEASARGAALLALEALEVIHDVAQVASNLLAPVNPDTERGDIYRKAAIRQQKLYNNLL
jgi:gluconokinase